jgi:chaperonin GroEL
VRGSSCFALGRACAAIVASSVAGLLVTTEAMVAEKPKPKAPPMPPGGMGGMGGIGDMDY